MDQSMPPAKISDLGADRVGLGKPLCRRYSAVVFGTASSTVASVEGEAHQAIKWAVGWLAGDEWEVLGAWARPNDSVDVLQMALDELHRRGAEHLEFVLDASLENAVRGGSLACPAVRSFASVEHAIAVAALQVPPRHRAGVVERFRASADADSKGAALAELSAFQLTKAGERYPSVVTLWEETLARWDALFSLPARTRHCLRLADRCAMDVSERLTRAMRRHGPFADTAAAHSFVADQLLRIERRSDRERGAVPMGISAAFGSSQRVVPMLGVPAVPTLIARI